MLFAHIPSKLKKLVPSFWIYHSTICQKRVELHHKWHISLRNTLSPSNAQEVCRCFHDNPAFSKSCEKSWTYIKAKSTCSSKTGQGFPVWNTSLSSHSLNLSEFKVMTIQLLGFYGHIGQESSSWPSGCPSLPYTASGLPAHPWSLHTICAQSHAESTCPLLLVPPTEKKTLATFSSCLPLCSRMLCLEWEKQLEKCSISKAISGKWRRDPHDGFGAD